MSRQAYPTQLRDHLGHDVRLPSKPFAVGGEGAVFDVLGRPDLVAKLYSKPQSKERCDKLRAMAKLCSADLLKIAAWPTATLNAGDPKAVDGILMPRVVDHLEIHHLYSVAQRKKDFPEADWGFLLHTARNCAIAFEAVHRHGHVVGDVNQKNVMVSRKGVVALVDCDSFQVAEGSRIFRCGVGVPEYTPPELHGKSFSGIDRAANHDNFGLAVLIFHLLMMGRHPFSGVPQVKTDIPIEKAIQEGLYVYARNPTKLKPPPHVPPVTMLDASTLGLFERAFGSARRPTATEWRAALDAAMKTVTRCKNDPRHSYLAPAGNCPWCHLIAVSRLMFFLPGLGAAATPFRPEDIQQLVLRLNGMQIVFPAYVRPRPAGPVQLSLPPGFRSVKKPSLLPRPAPPVPVQSPTLAPLPPPPALLSKPVLKPYPPAPAELPRPELRPIPLPDYPPPPTLGPPDPFLPRLCLVGMVAGFFVIAVAKPVGIITVVAFGVWWAVMVATETKRRGMALKSLTAAHGFECDRMDEEHAELWRPTEEANRRLMEAWQSANSTSTAKYQSLCKGIDDENVRQLAAWEAENASRLAAYHRIRTEIDQENQRLTAAYEALKAARQAEHDRASREVDAANRRLIADWEASNAPWVAEEKRWRDRAARAESEIRRLESELDTQRAASVARFQQRKGEAGVVAGSHDRAKQEYEKELKQAQLDSKNIQIEEHLDKFLIRQANLKGITGDRILSLESFGIETAKDVRILNRQKVPGIGPVLSQRLFGWRNGLVSSFVPKQSLPESERNRIASRYAPVLLPLAQSIQGAIQDLEGLIASHRACEEKLLKNIGAAAHNLSIAEAHLKAMRLQ